MAKSLIVTLKRFNMIRKLIALSVLLILSFLPSVTAATGKNFVFQAEVWADNWFALYVNGKKVGQDSVPISTEKSFNSEKIRFTATYPLTIGIVAKDFAENASGLEYIGKTNQQIGDGGIILQIRELNSGKIVAGTGKDWKVLTINKAPLNPECVKSINPLVDCEHSISSIPSTWASSTFKDSAWRNATEFTKEAIGVKEGYFDFVWSPLAALIWSSDLKLDNTILLRKTIKSAISSTNNSTNFVLSSPDFGSGGSLPVSYTCDGQGLPPSLSWSGAPSGTKSFVLIMNTTPGPPRNGEPSSESHAYLTLFNIAASEQSIIAGMYTGAMGLNFKDKNPGYTPPCSQGPGQKLYKFTLYALSSTIQLSSNQATEAAILKAIESQILGKTALEATYTRP